MTTLQMKVAIAAAELKSVTAAAKQLGISQPNASNCLKLLEEEIGFPVLIRASTGVSVTQKGSVFLKHARQILDETDTVMNLRNEQETYRLHLGTTNYYTAAEPFFALCAEHRDDVRADFSYCSISLSKGIEMLVKRKLDVLVAPVMKHQLVGMHDKCKKNNITATSICRIPTIMMLRREHPAASDRRCLNITEGCDTMKDYPYVGLWNHLEDPGPTGINDSDFVRCSSKIFVDDTNVRLRMIEATNGFGFGLLSSYRMMSQFGIIYFPVPDVSAEMFCMIRPTDSNRKEIREYLTLLRKEMDNLLH